MSFPSAHKALILQRPTEPLLYQLSYSGEVQANKSDGRRFVRMKVGGNGEVLYQWIYLWTKDAELARKLARVLDDITDPEEARRRPVRRPHRLDIVSPSLRLRWRLCKRSR